MNARFVFDVSTLFLWPRPPVGIVRAQYEVARWLVCHASNVAVLFVRFSDDRKRSYPVDNADVEQRLLAMDSLPRAALQQHERPRRSPETAPDGAVAPAQDSDGSPLAKEARKLLKAVVVKATPQRRRANLRAAWRVYRSAGAAGVTRKLMKRGVAVLSGDASRNGADDADPDLRAQVPLALRLADRQEAFLCEKDIFLSMGLDWDHSRRCRAPMPVIWAVASGWLKLTPTKLCAARL
jgi:hypothetical protein